MSLVSCPSEKEWGVPNLRSSGEVTRSPFNSPAAEGFVNCSPACYRQRSALGSSRHPTPHLLGGCWFSCAESSMVMIAPPPGSCRVCSALSIFTSLLHMSCLFGTALSRCCNTVLYIYMILPNTSLHTSFRPRPYATSREGGGGRFARSHRRARCFSC